MRSTALGFGVALALVGLSACGVNRIGTTDSRPMTLRAEGAFSLDQVFRYNEAVEDLSGGRLNVAPSLDVGASGADVLEHLRSRDADIGFVGTSAWWPSLGGRGFSALHAPLLVDSYDFQGVVLASPIMDELAAEAESPGLVVLGVLPGALPIPFSRVRALRSPGDFADLRIAVAPSSAAQSALTTLGAIVALHEPGDSLDAADGIEAAPSALARYGYSAGMVYGTANLSLSPGMIAVVMAQARLDDLTAHEQRWLRDAVRGALPSALLDVQVFEQEAVDNACRNGLRFVDASEAERAAVLDALAPVYDELRLDPLTSRAVDAIAALKTAPGTGLHCSRNGGDSTPSTGGPTPIDGTWRTCPTAVDIIAVGGGPGEARSNEGCTTFQFRSGSFSERGAAAIDEEEGTYSIDGDQLTILRANGEAFTFTWSLFRGRLTLGPPTDPNAISPATLRAVPMERTEG